jgi:hydroxymethylglutaryl-CoA lyase
MAEIDSLVGKITPSPGVRYTAIALNQKGRDRRAAWMPPLSDPLMPSAALYTHLCDTFARRNTNRSSEQERAQWPAIVAAAQNSQKKEACIAIGAAWGSNFEGRFSQQQRMAVLGQEHALWDAAGIPVTWVSFADPMSWCMPDWVEGQLTAIRDTWPQIRNVQLHLHDGRGMALPSMYAALRVLDETYELHLDVTAGGVGGCPYCGNGRATGMAPAEDVIHMLETMGISTGVDLEKYIDVVLMLDQILGRATMGHVSKAGPRPDRAHLYDPNLPLVETHEQAMHFKFGPEVAADGLIPWAEPIPAPSAGRQSAG